MPRYWVHKRPWGYRLLCGLLGFGLAWGLAIVPLLAQPTGPLEAAQTLTRQGQQQLQRGNPETALESWQAAERLYRQAGNQTGIIGTQLNQAKALQALGFYRRAKTLLEQVVALQQAQPASALQVNSLLDLGNLLRLIGEYPAAQVVLERASGVAQQLNSPPALQTAFLYLGNTFLAQQQLQQALDYFDRAAAIAAPLQLTAQLRQLRLLYQLQRQPEAERLLTQLQTHWQTLPLDQQSIYGRIELAALLPPTRERQAAQLLAMAVTVAHTLGDRRAESYAIGRLGQLYEQTRQFAMARSLTRQALNLARSIHVPEISYQWEWQLGRILQAEGDRPGARVAYSAAVDTLQTLRRDLMALGQDVQFSFREQVEPVYRGLVDLLLQTDASDLDLKKARQVIESLQLAELNNFFREACLEVEARPIDDLDPTAAVLYPVILPDRLEVILSLPGQPLRHYATHQPQSVIEAGIQQMQISLRPTSFTQERLIAAQQLYRWLLQPVAAELAQRQVKTLVFVLDGSLRGVPMAALHDGERYLIEQYQIALTPSLQLFSPRKVQNIEMRALVGGLSAGTAEVTPLPGVQQEVEEIQRQMVSQVLLDQGFTTTAFKQQVRSAPFTVVHLATHGQFSSEAKDTYVQTWDGRLTVETLQALLDQRRLSDSRAIELLVLSACETAEGDKRAALGMAGMAVRSGARSTLATLWAVNDTSTATFITQFYQALTMAKLGKAEAVRVAQLSLLQSREFKHPFYWAPFVLVGNWL